MSHSHIAQVLNPCPAEAHRRLQPCPQELQPCPQLSGKENFIQLNFSAPNIQLSHSAQNMQLSQNAEDFPFRFGVDNVEQPQVCAVSTRPRMLRSSRA